MNKIALVTLSILLTTTPKTALLPTVSSKHIAGSAIAESVGSMIQVTPDEILNLQLNPLALQEIKVVPKPTKPADLKGIAKQMVTERFGAQQFTAFAEIVRRESNWDYLARNRSSGAYGLAQALPGKKMASHGADWATNPLTQLEWMADYIANRYGNPANALAFHNRHHWY